MGSDGVFHSKPNVVFLYSINEHTEFIIQHGHFIDLYTIDFEEDKPEGEEEEAEEENKEDTEAIDDKGSENGDE